MIDITPITNAIDNAFLFDQIGVAFTDLHLLPTAPQESQVGWFQPGNVGNSGGGSAKAHGTSTWIPGALVTTKPVIPYDNFYFVLDLPVPETAPSRFVSVRQHSINNLNGWQALEFEHHFQWNGKIYNMAWQFDIADKAVRYFHYTGDPKTEDWVSTKIPLPSLTDLVTVAEFSIDTLTGTVTHVALTINGKLYPVNVTQQATAKPGIPNKLTIAEQMDSTAKPVPFSMTIGQCDLRYV